MFFFDCPIYHVFCNLGVVKEIYGDLPKTRHSERFLALPLLKICDLVPANVSIRNPNAFPDYGNAFPAYGNAFRDVYWTIELLISD